MVRAGPAVDRTMNTRLSREENDALLWLLERALVHIRAACWSKDIEKAEALADAFHNLPRRNRVSLGHRSVACQPAGGREPTAAAARVSLVRRRRSQRVGSPSKLCRCVPMGMHPNESYRASRAAETS
jgi:hypothetical protein